MTTMSKPQLPCAPPAAPPRPGQAAVTPDAIRARAHEIYLARMSRGLPGNQESDWVQAEREVSELARGGRRAR